MDLFDVGEAVKAARKGKAMTQQQLADKVGISRGHLETIENGRAPEVGLKYLMRILNEVGLDLRMTTLNANRPTLEDIRAEEEESHAPRMG